MKCTMNIQQPPTDDLIRLWRSRSQTVYLMMSSLPYRSQHFAENWKLIFISAVIPRHCSIAQSP